jgi:hypothetical protein
VRRGGNDAEKTRGEVKGDARNASEGPTCSLARQVASVERLTFTLTALVNYYISLFLHATLRTITPLRGLPHNKVYYFQLDWTTNHSDYLALYNTKISMPHLGIIQSTSNSYHYSSQTRHKIGKIELHMAKQVPEP